MAQHRFNLSAHWRGGRNSRGTIECGQLATPVSIDPRMGGPGVGTNPDEMLLSAAGTCYLMTLAAMIERAALATESLSLESEMIVTTNEHGAFVCESIVHRPHVTLARSASAEAMRTLAALITAAENQCMVSKALRGNVRIVVEPELAQAH